MNTPNDRATLRTMKSLLVFVPSELSSQDAAGYMFGKATYDPANGVKKFYIVGVRRSDRPIGAIGYYTPTAAVASSTTTTTTMGKQDCNACCDWIDACRVSAGNRRNRSHEYRLTNVVVNRQRVPTATLHTVVIVYDRLALLEAELFARAVPSSECGGECSGGSGCGGGGGGYHFQELKQILEKRTSEERASESRAGRPRELLVTWSMLALLYPVLFLSKITNRLLPVLKYSTLGLHLNAWLDNTKWMLLAVMRDKRFTLKTGNHILATIFDVSLGILLLRLLLLIIGDMPPSQILLDNAEKVVDFLKSLVDWLMGAPAGLKLNRSFNKMLGKFFLYHIHLWWTFLVFIKPVMDFAFRVLLLFGRLGVTFQIAIAADILALVSFHSYCIYVYAARLFNIQVRGLTALFRLFLGKKKNPLRERVDSCQYQPDQLFVGTLLFTILLFLMPTTWVYYTVFATLRVMLIGLGGLLTRLGFYMQVIPIYTFVSWFFRSRSTSSAVKLLLLRYPWATGEPVTLVMTTVAAPWADTWKRCIPDTITNRPSIEWATIVKNIFWGQLLYPL